VPLAKQYNDAQSYSGAEIEKAGEEQRLNVPHDRFGGWGRQAEKQRRPDCKQAAAPNIAESE
jgi:hypothetical protein